MTTNTKDQGDNLQSLVHKKMNSGEKSYTHDEVREMIRTVFDSTLELTKQRGRLVVSQFGRFSVHTRSACTQRNPKTGEPVQVGESRTISFRVASRVKKTL